MTSFLPKCLPTAIGSLPHADAKEACDLIMRCLPQVPFWPQLPNRSQLENMYVQYFGRFPGAVIAEGKVLVDRSRVDEDLERLYGDYLEARTSEYALDAESAAGFVEMRKAWDALPSPPLAVKGHVTGPISAGLQITDQDLKPILYDEALADALGKYLRLVVAEQERLLAKACEMTIVFLDEPFLSAVGSGIIQVSRAQAVELLSEVLSGLKGLKGIHCCGNTDWSLLLATPIDVLSFDAFDYAETIALYAGEIDAFLKRGGTLAWGIVPTDPLVLGGEDLESLSARLASAMAMLMARGVDRDEVMNRSWITPACGLTQLTATEAERALLLTRQLADRIRAQFFGQ